MSQLDWHRGDDHGPMALQEILLAGCPTVGVRTGASFVRNGETGVVVDRLPPGSQCAESDADVRALAVFMAAIDQAQTIDRPSVCLASWTSNRANTRVFAVSDYDKLSFSSCGIVQSQSGRVAAQIVQPKLAMDGCARLELAFCKSHSQNHLRFDLK